MGQGTRKGWARCKWVRGPGKGGQGVSGSGDQDRVGKV